MVRNRVQATVFSGPFSFGLQSESRICDFDQSHVVNEAGKSAILETLIV
jgi:hypothetical protein